MPVPTFMTVVPDCKEHHGGHSHSRHLAWFLLVLVVHKYWYVQMAFAQFKYPTSSLISPLQTAVGIGRSCLTGSEPTMMCESPKSQGKHPSVSEVPRVMP